MVDWREEEAQANLAAGGGIAVPDDTSVVQKATDLAIGVGRLARQFVPGALLPQTVQEGPDFVRNLLDQAYDGFTLPGDVYAGRTDPNSSEAVNRSMDLAMTLPLGGLAARPVEGGLGAGIRSRNTDWLKGLGRERIAPDKTARQMLQNLRGDYDAAIRMAEGRENNDVAAVLRQWKSEGKKIKLKSEQEIALEDDAVAKASAAEDARLAKEAGDDGSTSSVKPGERLGLGSMSTKRGGGLYANSGDASPLAAFGARASRRAAQEDAAPLAKRLGTDAQPLSEVIGAMRERKRYYFDSEGVDSDGIMQALDDFDVPGSKAKITLGLMDYAEQSGIPIRRSERLRRYLTGQKVGRDDAQAAADDVVSFLDDPDVPRDKFADAIEAHAKDYDATEPKFAKAIRMAGSAAPDLFKNDLPKPPDDVLAANASAPVVATGDLTSDSNDEDKTTSS